MPCSTPSCMKDVILLMGLMPAQVFALGQLFDTASLSGIVTIAVLGFLLVLFLGAGIYFFIDANKSSSGSPASSANSDSANKQRSDQKDSKGDADLERQTSDQKDQASLSNAGDGSVGGDAGKPSSSSPVPSTLTAQDEDAPVNPAEDHADLQSASAEEPVTATEGNLQRQESEDVGSAALVTPLQSPKSEAAAPLSSPDGTAMPEGKKYHYFLSFSKVHTELGRQPEELALLFHKSLEEHGFIGYLDTERPADANPESDKDKMKRLQQTVASSCALIVVLHDETSNSEWCCLEWQVAENCDLPTRCIADCDNFDMVEIQGDVQFANPRLAKAPWVAWNRKHDKFILDGLQEWLSSEMKKEVKRASASSEAEAPRSPSTKTAKKGKQEGKPSPKKSGMRSLLKHLPGSLNRSEDLEPAAAADSDSSEECADWHMIARTGQATKNRS
eukprot:TRINITY_DN32361_c0_g1_i1.p1 TRINITY_DN32361_c0_g1~~TRINITY_DN32361_c0_g1_i1.p1  ORF type:complete len:446 (+),score=104.86 TRINITY_DN32361_c0_g1_i1:43-1380(+)